VARRSRLVMPESDRAVLWGVVAGHRERAGDKTGAKRARWQAASIRSPYPVPRPEGM